MKDGDRERPIENYGKKEQKEWLNNTLPDPQGASPLNSREQGGRAHQGFPNWGQGPPWGLLSSCVMGNELRKARNPCRLSYG